MAEDLGERTEAPTGRKLSEARGEGRIPRSQDLGAAIDLIGAVVILVFLGGGLVQTLLVVMRRVLSDGTSDGLLTVDSIEPLVNFSLGHAALALLPLMLVMCLVAYVAQVVQVGLVWTTRPLEPKLNRLNFVANFGNLFGKRNIMKTVVDSVKLTLVMLVAWRFIDTNLAHLAYLPALSMRAGIWTMATMALHLAIWLLVVLLIIGLIDWFYQRWQHTQDLKMTKQDVKDERKDMDGDPKLKAKRFRIAQEIAMQRARHAVPTADVIVTNPTHYSVAIKYDADSMRAPKVVAKGVDHMALLIRQIASVHGVPLVERPPLARALYYAIDVGGEVPPDHYQAVAEILAYVYRIEQAA